MHTCQSVASASLWPVWASPTHCGRCRPLRPFWICQPWCESQANDLQLVIKTTTNHCKTCSCNTRNFQGYSYLVLVTRRRRPQRAVAALCLAAVGVVLWWSSLSSSAANEGTDARRRTRASAFVSLALRLLGLEVDPPRRASLHDPTLDLGRRRKRLSPRSAAALRGTLGDSTRLQQSTQPSPA